MIRLYHFFTPSNSKEDLILFHLSVCLSVCLSLSKICMDSAIPGSDSGGTFKMKHDIQSQNLFRRVVRKAESRGMVVNKGKTKVLCISDAQTYKAKCFLLDSDGMRIESGESMKVLGFHIDSKPSAHAHVKALQLRMRDTTWVLRHLKLAGFSQTELATVYRTVVRPVLDYCAVIYHPMLTDEQDQQVERLQAQALKNIYGYKDCLLYTSPSPRDRQKSRMPSSA